MCPCACPFLLVSRHHKHVLKEQFIFGVPSSSHSNYNLSIDSVGDLSKLIMAQTQLAQMIANGMMCNVKEMFSETDEFFQGSLLH